MAVRLGILESVRVSLRVLGILMSVACERELDCEHFSNSLSCHFVMEYKTNISNCQDECESWKSGCVRMSVKV